MMFDMNKDEAMKLPYDERSKPQLGEALRWALDTSVDPAQASADWLARDIDGSQNTAKDLLTNPEVTLTQLRKAKSAFKTMRIVGETSADRRLGARLYAAAIAAGLVWHGRRISSQSDPALERAFKGLLDDREMSEDLRSLAGKALCTMQEMT
jgi:hypothetical protein